jgi:GDPmannose 4,6-dehydratase
LKEQLTRTHRSGRVVLTLWLNPQHFGRWPTTEKPIICTSLLAFCLITIRLRPDRFVTKEIISTALRIAKGDKDKLILGKMQIERDWGWAPDYVETMWLMLQQDIPDDYIIATGQTHSLEEFVDTVFSLVDLDWREHVITDADLYRPLDLSVSKANPGKAWQKLGWQANHTMQDVVELMLRSL